MPCLRANQHFIAGTSKVSDASAVLIHGKAWSVEAASLKASRCEAFLSGSNTGLNLVAVIITFRVGYSNVINGRTQG